MFKKYREVIEKQIACINKRDWNTLVDLYTDRELMLYLFDEDTKGNGVAHIKHADIKYMHQVDSNCFMTWGYTDRTEQPGDMFVFVATDCDIDTENPAYVQGINLFVYWMRKTENGILINEINEVTEPIMEYMYAVYQIDSSDWEQ